MSYLQPELLIGVDVHPLPVPHLYACYMAKKCKVNRITAPRVNWRFIGELGMLGILMPSVVSSVLIPCQMILLKMTSMKL